MPSLLTITALSNLSSKFLTNIANDLKVIIALGQRTDDNNKSIDWADSNGKWKDISNAINTICNQMKNKGLGTFTSGIFTFQMTYYSSFQTTSAVDIASIDFSKILYGNSNLVIANNLFDDSDILNAISDIQSSVNESGAALDILIS